MGLDSHAHVWGSRYTAQTFDQDTKLYYYGARYYDPRTSVWESPDPILGQYLHGHPNGGVDNPANMAVYSYGYQNPIRYRDPNGKWLVDPIVDAFLIHDTGKFLGATAAWIQGAVTGNQRLRNIAFAGVVSNAANMGMDVALPGGSVAGHAAEDAGEHVAEDVGDHALEHESQGVVYKRTNPKTGEEYVGQAKSQERFEARQREHDRRLGVKHEYEALGHAKPGQDLDVLEEKMIREHGGLQKEGGTLANRRHQMSEERYRKAGGD